MSRQAALETFGRDLPVIAPSMLKCDFGRLADEIERLEQGGAAVLHWDVMDGHFVPNLSYGAMLIQSVRPLTSLLFDAHLMISEPERYLDDFVRAGCDSITVHAEVLPKPWHTLQRIRDAGVLAGLAVNPGTPVEQIERALEYCDLVLVMSVEPGFGGQEFMPAVLGKVRHLRRILKPGTLLSIDGGIGPKTIGRAAEAGAQVFVAGSAIFDREDYGSALKELAELAAPHVASPSLEL